MSILVITDSRGRYLQDKLNEIFTQEPPHIIVKVVPGGTIQAAEQLVENSYLDLGQIDILVLALGICNLTKKLKDENGTTLRYDSDDVSRQYKTRNLLDGINRLANSDKCKKVLIATIPPASLGKYNKSKNPGKSQLNYEIEQQSLLEDIQLINNKIKDINIEAGVPLIDWARFFFNISVKRRRSGTIRTKITKFTDTNLNDGVHFNDKVRRNCHGKLALVLQQTYLASMKHRPSLLITFDRETESQTSQDSEIEEQWDFKRIKSVCVPKQK